MSSDGDIPVPTIAAEAPLLAARGVEKRFGGVLALDAVDLVLSRGERLAVVGENGAGKSTLMRVLAGQVTPDAGTVLVDGREVTGSSEAARAAGIALCHQERSLVPELSVAENVTLGGTPTRAGFVRRREQEQAAAATLAKLGLTHLHPAAIVGRLSAAQQAFVEIAKALHQDPRVLILDEPSAMLTPRETTHLLELTRSLSDQGMAIVYISHRLPEIYAFCDNVMVLRDGKAVGRFALRELDTDALITKMAGQTLRRDRGERRQTHPGSMLLSAEGIVTDRVKDVSVSVRSGEIVGIGGLVGSGRSALLRAIVGLDYRRAGHVEIVVNGTSQAVNTFARAVRLGMAYVPEERRTDGVILSAGVDESLLLPKLARGWQLSPMTPAALRRAAAPLIDRLHVVPPDPRAKVGSLSGGNQQKVSFGKWLSVAPSVLILDEPTRGVDVNAKAEIHRLLRAWADDGIGVLFVSSDMPELLALADRIEVMRDGAMVTSIDRDDADEERILAFAAGQGRELGRHGS
jgi:ribose transport system ATP-binding protein